MVNPIEIIGSLVFLLFAAWLIYETQIKTRQRKAKLETPETKKSFYTRIFENLGGKKKPKITLTRIILLIILVLILSTVGSYFYRDTTPGAIYTFSSTGNLSKNWQFTPGSWTGNGCLSGSGKITLKNPDVMKGWTRIEFVPSDLNDSCGVQNLDGLTFQTGDLVSQFNIRKGISATDPSYLTGGIYYKSASPNMLLSSPSDEEIKSGGKIGPYPVGIRIAPWWNILEQKYIVYVRLSNEPIGERIIAYAQGDQGLKIITDGGGLIIKSTKNQIVIKEVRIYY